MLPISRRFYVLMMTILISEFQQESFVSWCLCVLVVANMTAGAPSQAAGPLASSLPAVATSFYLFPANFLAPDSRQDFHEPLDFGVLLQPMLQIAQKRRRVGADAPVGQLVIDPEAVLAKAHEPRVFQDLQMV